MEFVSNSIRLSATDLSNHLACTHLTQLNRLVALGEIKKPTWYDPSLDILIKRGQDHEAAYVEFLKKKGLAIANLKGQPLAATIDAMQNGIEVLVQARVNNENWLGYADILQKIPGESKFGKWSYEVQDTKLAQNTRAETMLQLCLYTDLLSGIQGTAPEKMSVVKPGKDFPQEDYRYAEFQSYYRLVKRNLQQTITLSDQTTYPDPVEHCSICRWWQVCDKKRHADDHLSLVSGMRSLHIVELQEQKINTLEQFADAPKIEKPQRGNYETFLRKQSQAKVQLDGRRKDKLLYELLPVESGRGFNRLPEPDAGDIYFDIEGDAFYEDGGLEYVLGYSFKDKGKLVYKRHWSTNRTEEKKAFIEFMQFVIRRWKRYPNLYIYHFAPYEPTAIKRLARVHAVHEMDVDDLLRAERFIDLHSVFKEGLLASVETYSLKALEKFTKYTRKVDLHDASAARKSVEIALELHEFKSLSKETIQLVEDYNEDDCLATEALHQWLEDLRTRLVKSGNTILRPELKTGEAGEKVEELDTRSQALYKGLTEKLPEDRSTWTKEEEAKWLLAHQIEYFRREDKSAWWEYFRVHELEHEDLLDERKAITGLEFVEALPLAKGERTPVHRYKYPPQELSLEEGDDLVVVKSEAKSFGSVKAISHENYIIDIKKTKTTIDVHPFSVHVKDVIRPGPLVASIQNLAESITDDGLDHKWPYQASKDLLMKRSPVLVDNQQGAYVLPGEEAVDAAIRIALHLDHSVLAIQGPPGSGKTYTGARMIIELQKAGKKIGITAVSHKVIRNLTMAAIELSREQKVNIQFIHKHKEKTDGFVPEIIEVDESDLVRDGLTEGKVACGTAWLWAEDKSNQVLDYLFVDEAGQMSLTHVLAASRAARNVILLGDPQQLEQPQKGAHPEGSDVAALAHLLDGQRTMPEGKGLFLGTTRRLHPAICQFTSEIFYEGRLTSMPGLEKQVISGKTTFDGAGLFYVPVNHKGNQSRSLEEVNAIVVVVENLLVKGKWYNEKGKVKSLQKEDILIVAPYNAQVSALIERLSGLRVGTVDKFQGQEAPVVIYSMTSSSPEDAPRGMSFLYSPNRLNVATSRAKCICILVASPKLLEPECRTIDQMKWANALCRFGELASGNSVYSEHLISPQSEQSKLTG